jgi:hypothetical protein
MYTVILTLCVAQCVQGDGNDVFVNSRYLFSALLLQLYCLSSSRRGTKEKRV